MTDSEIMKKLEYWAENSRSKHDVLLASADLHKQQQASIAELEVQLAGKDAIIKRQQDDHAFWMTEEMIVQKQLKAQLTASQRREQAAVDMVNRLEKDITVVGDNIPNDIPDDMVVFHRCAIMLQAIENWRGPQEAGKGKTE